MIHSINKVGEIEGNRVAFMFGLVMAGLPGVC
jgi:hypothetical protein